MKSELITEKQTDIDSLILSFFSLIKFINPNLSKNQFLIGTNDWLISKTNNVSKKLICVCTDGKIKNTENIFAITKDEALYFAKKITLAEKLNVKGISEIDNYKEDTKLVDFISNLKIFFNNKKISYVPEGYNGLLLLSHDVDYIQTNMMYRLGRIYYLLIYLRLGKFKMFFQNFIHFSKQVFIEKDWKHVKMLEIEKEFNITSSWFFFSRITENKKLFNPNYELKNNMVLDLMQKIKNNNSEIALHASPESAFNSIILNKEKANLASYSNEVISGNRHHMGRFNPKISFDIWIENKFEYDASFLANDKFMDITSTKHFFKIFNTSGNKSIIEFPTQWMDVQYLNFSAYDEKKFKSETFKVIDNAYNNNQVLSMNWHGVPYKWYTDVYREVLDYCVQKGFLICGYRDYLENIKD